MMGLMAMAMASSSPQLLHQPSHHHHSSSPSASPRRCLLLLLPSPLCVRRPLKVTRRPVALPAANDSFTGSVVVNSEDAYRCKSLEALFSYDKPIPEEIIDKPIGVDLSEKHIGDNPRCMDCQAKGAVLCVTCAGTGLYVDSIMESQGIIVKVRCLGCGGTGNIMCSECGGRGHL